MRTKLKEARAGVEHLQDQGEEWWENLHPVCRCGLLVELRRGSGQDYHYRCRENGPLCHVEYYNGGDAWVPFGYCVGGHSANGPVVRREDFDEHGERADDYP